MKVVLFTQPQNVIQQKNKQFEFELSKLFD